LVNRKGAEGGTVLVSFGAGWFYDCHVTKGFDLLELSEGRVREQGAVDEPQEGGAAKAAVVERSVIW
jgi:hypothetical protein